MPQTTVPHRKFSRSRGIWREVQEDFESRVIIENWQWVSQGCGRFFHAPWQTLGVPSAFTPIGQLHLCSCEYIVSSEFPKASHQGCRNGNRNENSKITAFFFWETLAIRKGYLTPYICKIVWRSFWISALKNLSKISIFIWTTRLSSPPHLIFAMISSSQNDVCSYIVCQQPEKHNKRTRALRHEVLYSWRIETNLT